MVTNTLPPTLMEIMVMVNLSSDRCASKVLSERQQLSPSVLRVVDYSGESECNGIIIPEMHETLYCIDWNNINRNHGTL